MWGWNSGSLHNSWSSGGPPSCWFNFSLQAVQMRSQVEKDVCASSHWLIHILLPRIHPPIHWLLLFLNWVNSFKHLPIHPPIHPFTQQHISIYPLNLFISSFIYPFTHSSIYSPIHSSNHTPIHLSVYWLSHKFYPSFRSSTHLDIH